MNTTQTLEQLQQLKLQGMYSSYQQVMRMPINDHPEAHELLALLVDAESTTRVNKKTERLKARSKLRYKVLITEIEYGEERNLSKQVVMILAQGLYIEKRENILITGATGCGKTFLACAFGTQACYQGYSVLYLNMNQFMEQIIATKLDGTYTKYIYEVSKVKLLILDEFGIAPLNTESKIALLQILEHRYETSPTIIIGQIPVSNWHNYINEPTLADAILDRITAKSHRIELKGKSLRTKIIS